MSQSSYFSLHPRLQQAIVSTLGWRSLRPVQEASIPPILRGDDAVILAPTAGGKTESAMLPLLNRLLTQPQKALPRVLYLCPLKALINNLLPRLQSLTRMVGHEAFAWHGEVTSGARKNFLKEPKSLLLTTPESLQVILTRNKLDPKELFSGLHTIVIDEVHAFCGEDRGDQLIALLHQIDGHLGRPVQRIGLSATVGNPEELLSWLSGGRDVRSSLVDPKGDKEKRMIEVHPVGSEAEECGIHLAKLMQTSPKSLLFVDSRRQAEELRSCLETRDIDALAHHSSLSQDMREVTETAFKKTGVSRRKAQAIVCTSTLELGLDVGDIDKVFQLGAPSTVSAFLQRFGRAGRRRGKVAHMCFVTDRSATFLQATALIRLAIKKQVEPVVADPRAFRVLVQQILLQVLRAGALAPDKLWRILEHPPCFSGIETTEKESVLQHMIDHEWLSKSGGRLYLTDKTEKRFGRSHFLELLSVFSGGASVSVKTQDGRELGSLDVTVALQLSNDKSAFILGGGSWRAKSYDRSRQTMVVTPAAGGKAVRWSGNKGELSFTLTREMRDLLTQTDEIAFLGPTGKALLQELRQEYQYLDGEAPLAWTLGQDGKSKICFEMWAGARVHRTLGEAAAGWLGTEATFDQRGFRVLSSRVSWEELLQRSLGEEPQSFLSNGLRLYEQQHGGEPSPLKFGELLPEVLKFETRHKWLYDLEGAGKVLAELMSVNWVSKPQAQAAARATPSAR